MWCAKSNADVGPQIVSLITHIKQTFSSCTASLYIVVRVLKNEYNIILI